MVQQIIAQSQTQMTLSGVDCIYTNFYSEYTYESVRGNGVTRADKMRVDSYRPFTSCDLLKQRNIVLIHGDNFNGLTWLNKPDGNPGFTAYFLRQGYNVYLVDLPGSTGSFFVNVTDCLSPDEFSTIRELTVDHVMREYTDSEKFPLPDGSFPWITAGLHTQWPAASVANDAIFENLMASTAPMYLPKHRHEQYGKAALTSLLKQIGPSYLVGHGTGANVALLAAEANHRLVRGLMMLEPDGPPCGHSARNVDGHKIYSPYITYDASVRPYGVSNVPVTFSPALDPDASLEMEPRQTVYNDGCWMAQKTEPKLIIQKIRKEEGQEPVPQLVGLVGVPAVMVASESSPHSVYDFATAHFLRQAGVRLDYIDLPKFGIHGNGHLMHLEMNSDEVADQLHNWVNIIVKDETDYQHKVEKWMQDSEIRTGRAARYVFNGPREKPFELEFIVQPDVVEPDVVEPDVVEPDVVEPDVVEPDVVEQFIVPPDVVEPDIVDPPPVEPTAQPDSLDIALSSILMPPFGIEPFGSSNFDFDEEINNFYG